MARPLTCSYIENDDVWVVDKENPTIANGEPNLFRDIMMNHPSAKDIRAIIDVGCHFRGIPNEKAARMIAEHLRNSTNEAEGVLYFDEAGNPSFLHVKIPITLKNYPAHIPKQ